MSKGLKALARVKHFMSLNCKHWKQDVGYIEEELKDGAKYKKAIEIVNNKGVLVDELKRSASVDDYNMTATYYDINYCKLGLLTQDEFDLLKEVFK